jgi:hypothetical protein
VQTGETQTTSERWVEYCRAVMKARDIELAMWREKFPHDAPFVREAAEAQAEGREPKYPPSACIG